MKQTEKLDWQRREPYEKISEERKDQEKYYLKQLNRARILQESKEKRELRLPDMRRRAKSKTESDKIRKRAHKQVVNGDKKLL